MKKTTVKLIKLLTISYHIYLLILLNKSYL